MTARFDAIKEAVAQSLGDWGAYLVTSATASTVTIANISTTQTTASPDQYNNAWVFALASGSSSGQQRRVNTNGYTASSGALGLNLNWSLIPSINDPVKITRLFPLDHQSSQPNTSYKTLVNRGLGKLLLRDRISLAITTSRTYSLATWAAWLDRPERLLRVLEPDPFDGSIAVSSDWRTPRLIPDADVPTLEIRPPFTQAVGSLTLEVLRPATTWVAVSAVWAESTVGLANEADQVAVSLEEAVKVARVEAFDVLRHRRDGERPAGDWERAYQEALAVARELPLYELGLRQQAPPEAA